MTGATTTRGRAPLLAAKGKAQPSPLRQAPGARARAVEALVPAAAAPAGGVPNPGAVPAASLEADVLYRPGLAEQVLHPAPPAPAPAPMPAAASFAPPPSVRYAPFAWVGTFVGIAALGWLAWTVLLKEAAPPAPMETAAGPASALGTASVAAYHLQIATVRNAADAFRVWQRLRRDLPQLFEGSELTIDRAEVNDRRVYRVRIGPYDRGEAERICGRLRAQDQDCEIVVRP